MFLKFNCLNICDCKGNEIVCVVTGTENNGNEIVCVVTDNENMGMILYVLLQVLRTSDEIVCIVTGTENK